MECEGLLDTQNCLHIELMRFCFGTLINYEVQAARKEWNQHRIRDQKNVNSSRGIPNELFNNPEKFGSKDYKKNLNLEDHQILKQDYITEEPYLIDTDFEAFVKIIIPGVLYPVTAEEAYNLYKKLLRIFEANLD